MGSERLREGKEIPNTLRPEKQTPWSALKLDFGEKWEK